MRKLLAEGSRRNVPNGLETVPLPLDPAFDITGLDPSNIILFKSAMYPAAIDFSLRKCVGEDPLYAAALAARAQSGSAGHLKVEEDASFPRDKAGQDDVNSERTIVKRKSAEDSMVAESIPKPPVAKYKIIFKSGDDLRQDQLIMQLISLMDGLLKKVNLDLGLLTYGILATGPTDGIMEFVQGSMPISAVLSSYGNSILSYLKHHNPDSKGPLGVTAEAMDMFVRSCASSCVVTYILGIGDRYGAYVFSMYIS